MRLRCDVRDLPDVQEALVELSKTRETRKEVKDGLKEAGKFLIKRGKERLKARLIMPRKDRTGNLLKSFKHRIKKKNAGVLVGFRNKGKNSGNHSWLVSEGTKPRKTSKGYNRGSVRPNNFWSDTRNQDSPKAMNIIMDHIEQAIESIKRRQ
jgi:hypothetical protein